MEASGGGRVARLSGSLGSEQNSAFARHTWLVLGCAWVEMWLLYLGSTSWLCHARILAAPQHHIRVS